jgi:trk system potassium uptake protein TrkA
MRYKFAVIGLGRFGTRIAKTLSERGAEVIAMDKSMAKVDALRDDVSLPVCMDSTDIRNLKAQNITEVDAVVIAIGEDFESLLLTVVHLMSLKIKRIIARASTSQQRMILEKMGVEEILSPEEEVGSIVAERLIHPNVKTFLQLSDHYEIAEIKAPFKTWNKAVSEIGFRESYKLNLITLRREMSEMIDGKPTVTASVIGVPKSDNTIYDTDTIIVFGTTSDIEKFVELNS